MSERKKLLLLSISILLKINIDRSIYRFWSINVSIFDKFSSIGMLHTILDKFWALNQNPAISFRKSISIDRYIDLLSINVYIDFWQILESRHAAYRSGSVLCPEPESGNIFSKIYIDRSIYRFSINQCIDFWQILESRHVAYRSGSVLCPEPESGNIFFRKPISIDIL